MTELPAEKRTALEWIDRHAEEMTGLADRIWEYSEPAMREYRSARAHGEYLRQHGFEVEEGAAGMPTAFVGTYGHGRPVLATYAEYDASPGQSQKPVARREPVVPYAAGFTDAHHMLGVAASTAAIAAAEVLQAHGLAGTIKVFGTPAEKLCAGKPYMAKEGYFDGVDAFLTWHPGHTSNNWNTARLESSVGSSYHVLYTFECKEPWKWSGIGGLSGVRHPGAFDAAMLMIVLSKYMREYALPKTGGWTISEFIMNGGQATVDDWPTEMAQVYFAIRSPELSMQDQIFSIIEQCAAAAAKATYTEVTTRIVSKTRPALPNVTLGRLMYRNLETVGPPRFSEEEREFGRELQRSLGLEPMAEPFNEELTPPDEVERNARRTMLPTQRHRGSDDSSELGWHAPVGRLMVTGSALKMIPGVAYPVWFEGALSGTTAVHKMGLVAARTIALSMVELLIDPGELETAWAEQRERLAQEHIPPLLPKDLAPPVGVRWPQWLDNRYPEEPVRNREWSTPPPEGWRPT